MPPAAAPRAHRRARRRALAAAAAATLPRERNHPGARGRDDDLVLPPTRPVDPPPEARLGFDPARGVVVASHAEKDPQASPRFARRCAFWTLWTEAEAATTEPLEPPSGIEPARVVVVPLPAATAPDDASLPAAAPPNADPNVKVIIPNSVAFAARYAAAPPTNAGATCHALERVT